MTKLPKRFIEEISWLRAAQNDSDVSVEEWRRRGNLLIEEATKLPPALFGEFDKLFSQIEQSDRQEALNKWLHAELKNPPRRVQAENGIEVYQVGAIKVTVPALDAKMGITLYSAVSRRREADFSGTCACGAVGVVENDTYVINHNPDCPAADKNLQESLRKFGLFSSERAS